MVLIAASKYSGKSRSIFSVMNYLMPKKGVFRALLSKYRHDGKTALFFDIRHGKTTLSADPNRILSATTSMAGAMTAYLNFEGGRTQSALTFQRE